MPTQLPRVSVIITPEQHALLSELASLDPDTRSIGGYIRQLVDEVTPLLRATVPMMRAAAQETDTAREKLREPFRQFLATMEQLDLLDPSATAGAPARSVSEDGRTTRRGGRK